MDFGDKKRGAIARILHRVRSAFSEEMQEIKADIIQNIPNEDILETREKFNIFAAEIGEALKSFDLHKTDNIITADIKKGSTADLLKLAIELYHKHPIDSQKLFAYAAFNTQDMHLDNLPNSIVVTNNCLACGSILPTICNFCPICGTKLDNKLTNTPIQQQPINPNIPDSQMALDQMVLDFQDTAQNPTQKSIMPMSIPMLPPIIQSSVKRLTKADRSAEAIELLRLYLA